MGGSKREGTGMGGTGLGGTKMGGSGRPGFGSGRPGSASPGPSFGTVPNGRPTRPSSAPRERMSSTAYSSADARVGGRLITHGLVDAWAPCMDSLLGPTPGSGGGIPPGQGSWLLGSPARP